MVLMRLISGAPRCHHAFHIGVNKICSSKPRVLSRSPADRTRLARAVQSVSPQAAQRPPAPAPQADMLDFGGPAAPMPTAQPARSVLRRRRLVPGQSPAETSAASETGPGWALPLASRRGLVRKRHRATPRLRPRPPGRCESRSSAGVRIPTRVGADTGASRLAAEVAAEGLAADITRPRLLTCCQSRVASPAQRALRGPGRLHIGSRIRILHPHLASTSCICIRILHPRWPARDARVRAPSSGQP